MTRRNAEKCCEVMAEINTNFEKWCFDKGYAYIDKIYGCFAIHTSQINPRSVLREYRKTVGFTDDDYKWWFRNYSYHYGDFFENSTI
jgi:hypothetical protein